jgi:hypothetical protein
MRDYLEDWRVGRTLERSITRQDHAEVLTKKCATGGSITIPNW